MSKVQCPICSKYYKELNNSHLGTHGLTIPIYDVLYNKFPRMSNEQRKKKARYQQLTPEMSKKLKKSHTLAGYQEKYGEKEGTLRFNESKINKSLSKTLSNYIRLYGQEDGPKEYIAFKKRAKTRMSLDNFIIKYGVDDGKIKYNQYVYTNKRSNTLIHYKEKYGNLEGQRKWDAKNLKNSLSSRKLSLEQYDEYKLYKTIVMRFTKQTIRNNDILNIHLIEKGKYAIDHKYSQLEGFKNNIPPYIIGSSINLEVISHQHNCSKQDSCSITLHELLKTSIRNPYAEKELPHPQVVEAFGFRITN